MKQKCKTIFKMGYSGNNEESLEIKTMVTVLFSAIKDLGDKIEETAKNVRQNIKEMGNRREKNNRLTRSHEEGLIFK